jgi:hypothetical protein
MYIYNAVRHKGDELLRGEEKKYDRAQIEEWCILTMDVKATKEKSVKQKLRVLNHYDTLAKEYQQN